MKSSHQRSVGLISTAVLLSVGVTGWGGPTRPVSAVPLTPHSSPPRALRGPGGVASALFTDADRQRMRVRTALFTEADRPLVVTRTTLFTEKDRQRMLVRNAAFAPVQPDPAGSPFASGRHR
jgi:hypothetical protein